MAINIINQFPNYANMANNMVDKLLELCETTIKENTITEKEVIELYKFVLETLREELKDD